MLVECALGRFPYPYPEDNVQELGFWELMRYITVKPPPILPAGFSEDFKDFISICMRK